MIDPIAHGLPHLIEVAIDEKIHPEPPADEIKATVWRYMDTAYGLLAELAVRTVFAAQREKAQQLGIPYPETDEALFAEMEKVTDAPQSYRDLYEYDGAAARHLTEAFEALVRSTMNAANEGLSDVIEEGN